VSNIERVMRMLDILVAEPGGARVTDLATALGVNRAIPHRLLAELIELGYVAQDPRTERYRATFKLGSLGLRQLEAAGIPRWSQDELAALAATTRELVRLAVASGSTLRWIAKAQGANSALIIDSVVRSDVVLHATATGKAWLSTLPDEDVEALLRARGLEAQTPHTETHLEQLLKEVGEARHGGYAVTYEEMEAGINAVAAPVVPPGLPGGRGVGTVSIAGPSARLTPDVLLSYVPALRSTADKLAAQWHVYDYLEALTTQVTPAESLASGETPAVTSATAIATEP
jgi:DNA-binding IclR family transcriptional regulator